MGVFSIDFRSSHYTLVFGSSPKPILYLRGALEARALDAITRQKQTSEKFLRIRYRAYLTGKTTVKI